MDGTLLIFMAMIELIFGWRPREGRSPEEHRGTFVGPPICSSIHLPPPPMWPFRPEICPHRPKICPHRPKICSFRPDIGPLWPEIYPLLPEIWPLMAEICPLRPEICLSNLKSVFSSPGPRKALSGFKSALSDLKLHGWANERKSPFVLQDFVSFGAAALLPLTPMLNHAKLSNGCR